MRILSRICSDGIWICWGIVLKYQKKLITEFFAADTTFFLYHILPKRWFILSLSTKRSKKYYYYILEYRKEISLDNADLEELDSYHDCLLSSINHFILFCQTYLLQ